mmetsp:Transcript_29241/g.41849  ORF Transcript_29241/g.41849 Transcript_29241/m.41849 type:complete len:206 (-) Transcript_29241:320-937(-)
MNKNISDLLASGRLQIGIAHLDDAPDLSSLVNQAYRGDSSRKGWTTEADLLDGQRVDVEMIQRLLANDEESTILVLRYINNSLEVSNDMDSFIQKLPSPILACVHAEAAPDGMYLGMLSIHPELQQLGLGRLLIQAVEDQAREKGLTKVNMTVIEHRSELISYYARRGYQLTNQTFPFPAYEDSRFGIPKRPDLRLVQMIKDLSV